MPLKPRPEDVSSSGLRPRPEDASGLKPRPEDATGLKPRPEDVSTKAVPVVPFPEQNASLSQGTLSPMESPREGLPLPTPGVGDQLRQGRTKAHQIAADFYKPILGFVDFIASKPIPGSEMLTKATFGQAAKLTGAVKKEAETMGVPYPAKAIPVATDFVAKALADGGITLLDVMTLGASKVRNAMAAGSMEAAAESMNYARKAEATAKAVQKSPIYKARQKIQDDVYKKVANKEISPEQAEQVLYATGKEFVESPNATRELVTKAANLNNPLPHMRAEVAATDSLVKQFKGQLETSLEQNLDRILMYESKPGQKISDTLFDLMESGQLDPIDAAKIMSIEVGPKETANALIGRLKEARTSWGQGLNRLSQMRRALDPYLKRNTKLRNALNDALRKDDGDDVYDWVLGPAMGISRDLINVWRGTLVGQVSTATANIISQTGRYSIGTFNDVVKGIGMAARGFPKGESLGVSFADAIEDFHAIGRALSKDGLDQTLSALEKFPVNREMINAKFFSEAGMSTPWIRYIGFMNNTQEKFFRSAIFDARLRSTLRKSGLSVNDLPALIDDPVTKKAAGRMIDDATQRALEWTFSAPPKSKIATDVLKVYKDFPVLYALTTPFPRFMMNSTKFILENSPLGVMMPKAWSFKGGPKSYEKNWETLSKAFTGTLMLSGAMALRGSEYAGPNWYEVRPDPQKKPFKVVSLQTQGPLMANAFLADVAMRIIDVQTGRRRSLGYGANEISKAMFSVQRSDISMIPLLDNTVFGKSELLESQDKFMKIVTDQVRNFLGGFAVPVKGIRDIINGTEPMERKDARQASIYGSFADNIPGWRDSLPTRFTPTRSGPAMEDNPFVKQFGGARIINRNELEHTLETLKIRPYEWVPKTGVAYVDNLIDQRVGDFVPDNMAAFMKDSQERFSQLQPEDVRILVLEQLRALARTQKEALLAERPDVAAMVKRVPTQKEKIGAAWAGLDPVTWEPYK